MRVTKYLFITFIILFIAACSNSKNDEFKQYKSKPVNSNASINDFIELEYFINTNNLNVAQPDAYGRNVVWAGGNNRNKNNFYSLDSIYMYTKSTQEVKKIAETQINGQTDETQINGNWITWTDWSNIKGTDWSINAYSKSDGKIIKITDASGNKRPISGVLPRLSISENYLVWTESIIQNGKDIQEIKLYNFSTKEIKSIATIDFKETIPHVSETYIVWFDPHNVYIYSIKEGKIVEKINSENLINYPKVNEKFIVWEEKLQNESKLFLKLIGDNQEPTLLLNGNLFYYDIGKSYVVWQSDHLISAYSTILNKAQIIGENGTLPYIRQNIVVWEHERNKENDVVFKIVKLKD